MSENIYELEARMRKVQAILDHLHLMKNEQGATDMALYKVVLGWTKVEWTKFCQECGIRVPSDTTIREVIVQLRRRIPKKKGRK